MSLLSKAVSPHNDLTPAVKSVTSSSGNTAVIKKLTKSIQTREKELRIRANKQKELIKLENLYLYNIMLMEIAKIESTVGATDKDKKQGLSDYTKLIKTVDSQLKDIHKQQKEIYGMSFDPIVLNGKGQGTPVTLAD